MSINKINVLVLCQRSGGTRGFNIKNVQNVQKDIDYLMDLNSLDKDDEIVVTEFLTTGYNEPDDQMTFKINFNYTNRETLDFVADHIGYYNFIVIAGCPFTIFNDNNVEILSNILKKGGQIIVNPRKSFDIWKENTIDSFKKFFNIIQQDAMLVMRKKSEKRKLSSLPALRKSKKSDPIDPIVIDDNEDDKKVGFHFGSVESDDKKIGRLFDEIETGGGGSCLFTSLAYSLGLAKSSKDIKKEAKKIRQKICKYNPPDLAPFVSVAEGEKSMCRMTTYGTVIEIEKASRLYKKPIIVYKEGRKSGIASNELCPGVTHIKHIKESKMFTGMKKYFFTPFKSVLPNMYCIFLPEEDTDSEPIILYNIEDIHYRSLNVKKSIKTMKSRKTDSKSRKSRKSKKSRRSVRKSRKTDSKSRRSVRKSRRSVRKSRRSRMKSRRSRRSVRKSRKSRRSVRKSKKSRKIRKSRRSVRNSRKIRKSRRSVRKSKKSSL